MKTLFKKLYDKRNSRVASSPDSPTSKFNDHDISASRKSSSSSLRSKKSTDRSWTSPLLKSHQFDDNETQNNKKSPSFNKRNNQNADTLPIPDFESSSPAFIPNVNEFENRDRKKHNNSLLSYSYQKPHPGKRSLYMQQSLSHSTPNISNNLNLSVSTTRPISSVCNEGIRKHTNNRELKPSINEEHKSLKNSESTRSFSIPESADSLVLSNGTVNSHSQKNKHNQTSNKNLGSSTSQSPRLGLEFKSLYVSKTRNKKQASLLISDQPYVIAPNEPSPPPSVPLPILPSPPPPAQPLQKNKAHKNRFSSGGSSFFRSEKPQPTPVGKLPSYHSFSSFSSVWVKDEEQRSVGKTNIDSTKYAKDIQFETKVFSSTNPRLVRTAESTPETPNIGKFCSIRENDMTPKAGTGGFVNMAENKLNRIAVSARETPQTSFTLANMGDKEWRQYQNMREQLGTATVNLYKKMIMHDETNENFAEDNQYEVQKVQALIQELEGAVHSSKEVERLMAIDVRFNRNVRNMPIGLVERDVNVASAVKMKKECGQIILEPSRVGANASQNSSFSIKPSSDDSKGSTALLRSTSLPCLAMAEKSLNQNNQNTHVGTEQSKAKPQCLMNEVGITPKTRRQHVSLTLDLSKTKKALRGSSFKPGETERKVSVSPFSLPTYFETTENDSMMMKRNSSTDSHGSIFSIASSIDCEELFKASGSSQNFLKSQDMLAASQVQSVIRMEVVQVKPLVAKMVNSEKRSCRTSEHPEEMLSAHMANINIHKENGANAGQYCEGPELTYSRPSAGPTFAGPAGTAQVPTQPSIRNVSAIDFLEKKRQSYAAQSTTWDEADGEDSSEQPVRKTMIVLERPGTIRKWHSFTDIQSYLNDLEERTGNTQNVFSKTQNSKIRSKVPTHRRNSFTTPTTSSKNQFTHSSVPSPISEHFLDESELPPLSPKPNIGMLSLANTLEALGFTNKKAPSFPDFTTMPERQPLDIRKSTLSNRLAFLGKKSKSKKTAEFKDDYYENFLYALENSSAATSTSSLYRPHVQNDACSIRSNLSNHSVSSKVSRKLSPKKGWLGTPSPKKSSLSSSRKLSPLRSRSLSPTPSLSRMHYSKPRRLLTKPNLSLIPNLTQKPTKRKTGPSTSFPVISNPIVIGSSNEFADCVPDEENDILQKSAVVCDTHKGGHATSFELATSTKNITNIENKITNDEKNEINVKSIKDNRNECVFSKEANGNESVEMNNFDLNPPVLPLVKHISQSSVSLPSSDFQTPAKSPLASTSSFSKMSKPPEVTKIPATKPSLLNFVQKSALFGSSPQLTTTDSPLQSPSIFYYSPSTIHARTASPDSFKQRGGFPSDNKDSFGNKTGIYLHENSTNWSLPESVDDANGFHSAISLLQPATIISSTVQQVQDDELEGDCTQGDNDTNVVSDTFGLPKSFNPNGILADIGSSHVHNQLADSPNGLDGQAEFNGASDIESFDPGFSPKTDFDVGTDCDNFDTQAFHEQNQHFINCSNQQVSRPVGSIQPTTPLQTLEFQARMNASNQLSSAPSKQLIFCVRDSSPVSPILEDANVDSLTINDSDAIPEHIHHSSQVGSPITTKKSSSNRRFSMSSAVVSTSLRSPSIDSAPKSATYPLPKTQPEHSDSNTNEHKSRHPLSAQSPLSSTSTFLLGDNSLGSVHTPLSAKMSTSNTNDSLFAYYTSTEYFENSYSRREEKSPFTGFDINSSTYSMFNLVESGPADASAVRVIAKDKQRLDLQTEGDQHKELSATNLTIPPTHNSLSSSSPSFFSSSCTTNSVHSTPDTSKMSPTKLENQAFYSSSDNMVSIRQASGSSIQLEKIQISSSHPVHIRPLPSSNQSSSSNSSQVKQPQYFMGRSLSAPTVPIISDPNFQNSLGSNSVAGSRSGAPSLTHSSSKASVNSSISSKQFSLTTKQLLSRPLPPTPTSAVEPSSAHHSLSKEAPASSTPTKCEFQRNEIKAQTLGRRATVPSPCQSCHFPDNIKAPIHSKKASDILSISGGKKIPFTSGHGPALTSRFGGISIPLASPSHISFQVELQKGFHYYSQFGHCNNTVTFTQHKPHNSHSSNYHCSQSSKRSPSSLSPCSSFGTTPNYAYKYSNLSSEDLWDPDTHFEEEDCVDNLFGTRQGFIVHV